MCVYACACVCMHVRVCVSLTLCAGHPGGIASSPPGTVEVLAVVETLVQGQLRPRAPHPAHHHRLGDRVPLPVPRLLGTDPRQTDHRHSIASRGAAALEICSV